MKTILYKFCILFFFYNFTLDLFGQVTISVDEAFEALKIGKNLTFIEDSNLVLSPALAYQKLKKGEGTFSVQSDVPQFGFQNATKWALFINLTALYSYFKLSCIFNIFMFEIRFNPIWVFS